MNYLYRIKAYTFPTLQAPLVHIVNGQRCWLSASRCVFWEQEQTLILSDLHFGKTGHFRKSGIAVPQKIYKEDLQRLVTAIQHFEPRQLIIAGDLFHSYNNKELELFKRWRNDLPGIRIHLVKGNHDILEDEWYKECGMDIHHEELRIGHFVFRHDPATATDGNENDKFVFCGHLHPGISLRGSGRQSLHFPCFYFTEDHCVLPAFSHFTGTYTVNPGKNDTVFAIINDTLMKIGR